MPAIAGKEARKEAPGREGLLGVEGISDDLILRGLQLALDSRQDASREGPAPSPITYSDLYEWGISGTANSAARRRQLLRQLGLPPRLSKKELLQVLSTLYTRDSLSAYIASLEA